MRLSLTTHKKFPRTWIEYKLKLWVLVYYKSNIPSLPALTFTWLFIRLKFLCVLRFSILLFCLILATTYKMLDFYILVVSLTQKIRFFVKTPLHLSMLQLSHKISRNSWDELWNGKRLGIGSVLIRSITPFSHLCKSAFSLKVPCRITYLPPSL